MAAVKPLLITRNLSRSFGGLKAVDMVDFAVAPGEVRAIIGPNGAGKTTFVSLIAGRIEPSSRRDRLRQPRHHPSAGLQACAARHRLHVPDHQRLRQPVGARQCRARGAARARRMVAVRWRPGIKAALSKVGLDVRANAIAGIGLRSPATAGDRDGAGAEAAPAHSDEPTQGLSDSEIEAFIKLIRELRKETTILLIEHNMQVVMRLADRITVLDAGKVLAEVPTINPRQQGGAGGLSRRARSGGRAWLTR
jgi:branched-chain amino acid transport system ATP-binding protein